MAEPIAIIDQDQHLPAANEVTPRDPNGTTAIPPLMDGQPTVEDSQPLVQPLPLRESIEEILRPQGGFYAQDTEDHRQNITRIFAASSGTIKDENARLRRVVKALMDDRDYIEGLIRDRDSIFATEKSNFRRQRDAFLRQNRRLQREVDRLKAQLPRSDDSNQLHLGHAFDVQRAVSAYQRQMDQQQALHNQMMQSAHREKERLKLKIGEQAAKIRSQERKLDENEREFADLATYLEVAQRLNTETAFERITQAIEIMNPSSPPIPSDRPRSLPTTSTSSEGRTEQRLNQLLEVDDSGDSVQSSGSHAVDQLSETQLSGYQSAEQCMNSSQSDQGADSNEEGDFGARQFSDVAARMSHELTDEQQPEDTAHADSSPSQPPNDIILLQPDVYQPNENLHQRPASVRRRRPRPSSRVADGFWQAHDRLQRMGGFDDLQGLAPPIQQGPIQVSSSSLVDLRASVQLPQQGQNLDSSSSLADLRASLPPVQQSQTPDLSYSSVIQAAERWTVFTHPGALTGVDQDLNSSMTSTTTQDGSQRLNAISLPLSGNNSGGNAASSIAAETSVNRTNSPTFRQTHPAVAPILTNFGPDCNLTTSLVPSPASGTITDATDGSVAHRIDRAIEHVSTYGVTDFVDIDTPGGSAHDTDQSSAYNLRADTSGDAAINQRLATGQRRNSGSDSMVGNVVTQMLSSNSDVAAMPQTDTDNDTHRAPHTEDHQNDLRGSDPDTYSIQIGYDPRAPTMYAPLPNDSTTPVPPADTRRRGQWISLLVIDNEDVIMEQERRRMLLTPNSASQVSSASPADDTMILETGRLGPTARRELDEWGQRHLFSSGQIYGLLGLVSDTNHQDNARDPYDVQQTDLQVRAMDGNYSIQTAAHNIQPVSNQDMTPRIGEDQPPEQGMPIIVVPDLSQPTGTAGVRNRNRRLGGDSRLRDRYPQSGQRRSLLASLGIFNFAGTPRVGLQDQQLGQDGPVTSSNVPSDYSEPTLVSTDGSIGGALQVEFNRSMFTRQLSHIWTKVCISFSWLLTCVKSIILYQTSGIVAAYQSILWLIHLLRTTPFEELAPILHTIGSVLFDRCKTAIQDKCLLLRKYTSWSLLYTFLVLYAIYITYGASRARSEWYTANTSTMRGKILAYREDNWDWRFVTYLRWYLQLAVERQSGVPVQIIMT